MFRSALNVSLKKVLKNTWIITRKDFWFGLVCPPLLPLLPDFGKKVRNKSKDCWQKFTTWIPPRGLLTMRYRHWNPHCWTMRDSTWVSYCQALSTESERALFIISVGRTSTPVYSKGMKYTQFTSHPRISSRKSSRHLCAWKAQQNNSLLTSVQVLSWCKITIFLVLSFFFMAWVCYLDLCTAHIKVVSKHKSKFILWSQKSL